MLPGGAPKPAEGGVPHLAAPLQGDGLHGFGHGLHGNGDEARCHSHQGLGLSCGLGNGGRHGRQLPTGRHRIQGRLAIGAKHGGTMLGLQLAQDQVAVRHREGTATAVAGWARIRAGAVRPHLVTTLGKGTDGAPARRHRMDVQHGRLETDTGHLGLQAAAVLPMAEAHVRGGASHVEADHGGTEPRGFRHRHSPHHARCGTGQNGVFPLKLPCCRQAPAGLHEQQGNIPQLCRQVVHVTLQERGEIGVHNGGLTAPHHLDQGAHLVAEEDVTEADVRRNGPTDLFMGRGTVAMEQHNGQGANPRVMDRLEGGAGLVVVQGANDPALGINAFFNLHHLGVEQLGPANLQVKQAGPGLVANGQNMAKPTGDGQGNLLAFALQQGIGGHGGAYPHLGNGLGRNGVSRGQVQHLPNALHRCVQGLSGVIGKQFMGFEAAVRSPGHDVGERAPPVNPEPPLMLGHITHLDHCC